MCDYCYWTLNDDRHDQNVNNDQMSNETLLFAFNPPYGANTHSAMNSIFLNCQSSSELNIIIHLTDLWFETQNKWMHLAEFYFNIFCMFIWMNSLLLNTVNMKLKMNWIHVQSIKFAFAWTFVRQTLPH